jgi:hypothetical protein
MLLGAGFRQLIDLRPPAPPDPRRHQMPARLEPAKAEKVVPALKLAVAARTSCPRLSAASSGRRVLWIPLPRERMAGFISGLLLQAVPPACAFTVQ